MKETIKNIPFLGTLLVKIYSKILRVRNKKFLKKNREIKDLFSGKRCFIIATGSSIKNQDLKKLRGELCISVSNFFVHPDFKEIRPAFHLFVPSHPPVTPEQYGSWFRDSEKHFPEGQNVLVSITDKKIVEDSGAFAKQNVYYYEIGHRFLENKEIDFTKAIPVIQTSPHIAMYLGLYLGAREINLLGVDHDWLLHLGQTVHFYDEKESSLSRQGYDEWSGGLEHQFESHLKLWQMYRRIKNYCKARGVEVYNLNSKSLLDVFPKKELSQILTP